MSDTYVPSEPVGIEGWLLLFLACQALGGLAVVVTVSAAAVNGTLSTATSLLFVPAVLLNIMTIAAAIKGWQSFRLWGYASVLYPLAITAFASAVLQSGMISGSLTGPLFGTVVWCGYLAKSKRVAATFGYELQAPVI